jgi:hypothetical protein
VKPKRSQDWKKESSVRAQYAGQASLSRCVQEKPVNDSWAAQTISKGCAEQHFRFHKEAA